MPISLEALSAKLNAQIATVDGAFDRHLTLGGQVRRVDRHAAREGYISTLWQVWGRFLRSVIISSAKGAVKGDGTITTSAHSGRSDPEIAYVIKQISQGKGIGTVKALPFYSEPTWGDTSRMIQAVAGLGTSNTASILSALSIPASIDDLQLCRNACAHLGIDQLTALKGARVRYSSTYLLHPSDAATWIDPATGGYLWNTWVDEIRTTATFISQ